MDWATIVPTLTGGALSLAGTLLAQSAAERRAFEREAREREHERETWARDLRHAAHVEFMRVFDATYRGLTRELGPNENPLPPDDYLLPVWSCLDSLRLVSTAPTITAAEDAVRAVGKPSLGDDRSEQVEYTRDRYLGAMRDEFGMPPIPLMGD